MLAFELLFPCLNPNGGIYMVEDLGEGPCTTTETGTSRIDDRPCNAPNPFVAYMQQRGGDMILNCSKATYHGYRGCYPRGNWQLHASSVHFYSCAAAHARARLAQTPPAPLRRPVQ